MADPMTMAALAGANLIGSGIQGYFQKEAAEAAAAAQLQAAREAMEFQREGFRDIQPYWDPYLSAGQGALSELSGLAGQYVDPGRFDYHRSVDEFLDPSMQYQQEAAREQLEASAAAGGGLLSGAALKSLQERGQQLAQQDYGNAYSRMMQDKNFAYQNFISDFERQRAANADRFNQLSSLANVGLQGAGALTGARTGLAQNLSGLRTDMGNIEGAQAAAGPMFWANLAGQTTENVTPLMGLMGGGADPQMLSDQAAAGMEGYTPAPMQGYTPNYAGAPRVNYSGYNVGNL